MGTGIRRVNEMNELKRGGKLRDWKIIREDCE